MKKLGKLKLNQLSEAELEARKMNVLRGGTGCTCGCSCDCTCCCGRNTDPEASLGMDSSQHTMASDGVNNNMLSTAHANGYGSVVSIYTYKL